MNTTGPGPERVATSPGGAARLQGRFRPRPARLLRLFSLVALWYRRWEQRAALAALDDHLLRDIGKTRIEARDEAAKPFWRP